MLITPFMSCSARLPIYILFAEMFFKERAMIVAYSMYLIGLVVAILVAAVIHLIDKRKSENYLLIELPEYKIPSSRTVAIYVWEKVKDYLTKAGTTIFVASIAMWILLNFGPHGYTTEMVDSFGAVLGHWLVPFFEPIGLGYWQIAVALIAGISAKEVVVSSCAVLFGIPNITSEAGMNTLVGILGTAGFGQLNAFCLMIFCLLYIPCAAAMATIKREARSWKWMCFSAVFQLAVAWGMTFIIYRMIDQIIKIDKIIETHDISEELSYITDIRYDIIIINYDKVRIRHGDFKMIFDIRCKTQAPLLVILEGCEIRDKLHVLNMKADDYIEKPINIDELEEKMLQLLHKLS